MNTNYWNETPLLRFLPFFIAGILLVIYVDGIQLAPLIWLSAAPIFIISLQKLFPERFYSYRRRWLYGLCSYCLMFLFGSILTFISTETHYHNHFSHYVAKQC